jgi:hypothetical protein
VAALVLLSGTTSAAARQETSLPRSGIAVETNRGVDVVGLDGRVLHVFDRRGRAKLIHALPDVRPLSVAFWR